jgi:predicted nucleotide-binding protein
MHARFAAAGSLIDALKYQKIVAGNQKLAERIAEIGETIEVPGGHTVIHQGAVDDEVYLILDGSFDVVVNGKTLARRVATDHVGEMAAILPVQRRAASVVAHDNSVVVRLSNSQIIELGAQFPQIWRTFAKELAHRVEQRNTIVATRNEKVRVLILAAPSAGIHAHELKRALPSLDIHLWEEGAFGTGNYPIENLERVLDRCDIAVAISEAGNERDSIILELGFFMGRLGRHRTFLIEPHGQEIDLPREMGGINTIHFRRGELHVASQKLAQVAAELGPNR